MTKTIKILFCYIISVWLTLPADSQTVISLNEVKETGLHVIEITTDGNEKLPVIRMTGDFDYNYQEGTFSLTMPNGETTETLAAKVKWRGGSTNIEGKHKRNYKIKFSSNQQLMNMRKDNNWILDAGQADLFRLRNRIATELWNDIATKPYYNSQETDVLTGVRGQVVELYLNDEYRGIYCLTECMDRKQLKLKKFDTANGEIHGELWKSKSYGSALMWDCPTYYDNKSETWDVFEVKYPDMDDLPETDWSILYNAINFVANSSDEEFVGHVAEYFDIPVIIDYYIFLKTLSAFDNVGKNMFWAVYDKQNDKKLTLAVWDLDATVGAKWLGDWSHPEYDRNVNLKLIKRLQELDVDHFNQKATDRYYALRDTYLSTNHLINRYQHYYELLKKSGAARREEAKWSEDSDVNGEVINFDSEIEYITNWITIHMPYLDKKVFPKNPAAIYNINTTSTPHDQRIFNLAGQMIGSQESLKQGIYIRNGKKFVVKR